MQSFDTSEPGNPQAPQFRELARALDRRLSQLERAPKPWNPEAKNDAQALLDDQIALVKAALKTAAPDDPEFPDLQSVAEEIFALAEVCKARLTQAAQEAGSAPTLAQQYLTERGITEETIRIHGIEIDTRASHERARERLGRKLPDGTNEVIWIPLYNASGNVVSMIARPLPSVGDNPKYICPAGSDGCPFIPKNVYSSKAKDLLATEGPIKSLCCNQAGVNAIGLNGVWGAANKRVEGEPVTLRAELALLCKVGSRVFLAFDADQDTNPRVRQALIRAALLLINAGAEVFQLTTWTADEGKGIDDYLVKHPPAAETLAALMRNAKPFLQTLSANVVDAQLVQAELPLIDWGPIVLDQIVKQLAHSLGVRIEVLRDVCTGPIKAKPELSFAAVYEPWPEPVNGEELFGEVMLRIRAEAIIDEAQQYVAALEVFLTWVHEQMDFSPILYITGPTRECGKTRLLGAIGKMARRPLKTSSITAPSLFRLSEFYHPTVLVDESQDAVKNEDFCTVLKAGHDPSDVAVRCDPNTLELKTFDVFCPKVLAGIGRANGQIMSRSITIEMERSAGEVESGRKPTDPVFVESRRKLARWANDAGDLRRFHLPKEAARMRQKDNWEVYYRVACGISEYVAKELLKFIPNFVDEEQDFDTYLLNSLRELYREHDLMKKGGHLGSEMIVNALNENKEAPWFAERRGKEGKGLTTEKLSSRLRRYKVKPEKHWYQNIEQEVRGYFYIHPINVQKSLKRVLDQYLPPEQ